MSTVFKRRKTTVNTILQKKLQGDKIAVLTAYDYFIARLIDQAGADMILVGDSAANVIHGFGTTIPVTMEMMLSHTAAVSRGTDKALVIADMPFLSYQPGPDVAISNAGRFLKESGAESVKMEGGLEMAHVIRRVAECGIPVMGHIGLTPQSIHRFGGPKVQGREEKSRQYLKESALALEDAGCFAIVLELIEASLAGEISRSLKHTATIGIGAGPECDGQVLVTNDMLGLREPGFKPKFLREYADLTPVISDAVGRFLSDVRTGKYPNKDESF